MLSSRLGWKAEGVSLYIERFIIRSCLVLLPSCVSVTIKILKILEWEAPRAISGETPARQ
ncbi:MAG: hypothetical protein LQ348_006326 [Seirophora lacunosa]|nr:MAG: hypothetical protein LQ348_006326 [Seirophora lacunosa]